MFAGGLIYLIYLIIRVNRLVLFNYKIKNTIYKYLTQVLLTVRFYIEVLPKNFYLVGLKYIDILNIFVNIFISKIMKLWVS